METTPLDSLAEWLTAAVGAPIDLRGARPVGGGCIHDCYRIEGGDSAWFVKINAAAKIGSLRGDILACRSCRRRAVCEFPRRSRSD